MHTCKFARLRVELETWNADSGVTAVVQFARKLVKATLASRVPGMFIDFEHAVLYWWTWNWKQTAGPRKTFLSHAQAYPRWWNIRQILFLYLTFIFKVKLLEIHCFHHIVEMEI